MMNRITPRLVGAIAALVILGMLTIAFAAKPATYRATGTATLVSLDESGNHFVFSHVGRSSPGGKFTGDAIGHSNATFQKQSATVTFDYGDGNTLTVETKLEGQTDGSLVGPYVVTGGTGIYENAVGSGTQTVFASNPDGTRDFQLVGTLSQ